MSLINAKDGQRSRAASRNRDYLVIALLLGIHFVVNLLWLRADTFHPDRVPDGYSHTVGLLRLITAMELGGLWRTIFSLSELQSHYVLVPHLPLALAAHLFGPDPLVYRAANVFYLAILLVAVYQIGRFCHSRRAGLLSAALVSFCPAVYGSSRSVGLDFPVLCMTPLAVSYLLRSDSFRHLNASALFGVFTGLATLAKAQALFFLFPPAAFAFARGLYLSLRTRPAPGVWRPFAGAALSLLSLAFVTSIWWGGRLGDFSQILGAHVTGEGMHGFEGDVSFLGGVTCYLAAFPEILSPWLAVVLLPAAFLFARRGRGSWEVLAWIVIPVVLHVFLKIRHFRYLFPLVPAAAVVLGVAASSLRTRLRGPAELLLTFGAAGLWLLCSTSPMENRKPSCVRAPPLKSVPIVDAFLSCGECGMSGSPGRGNAPMAASSVPLSRFLGRVRPDGDHIILYHTGEPWSALAAVEIQARLPRLRTALRFGPLDDSNDPALKGWRRYLMVFKAGARPPSGRVVFQAPARDPIPGRLLSDTVWLVEKD